MNTKLLIIIGMSIVTYLPRLLPSILIDKMKYGKQVEKFLKLIPYTAMASLIFPAILTVDPNYPIIGIAGAIVAIIIAWFKYPVMLSVLAAIGVDYLIYLFII